MKKGLCFLSVFSCLLATAANANTSVEWPLDNLNRIAGQPTKVLGDPKVITTEYGKAVEFDGIDDGIIIDTNPVEGMQTFTAEVIFKPYSGGNAEQRFVHFQEYNNNDRVLFETRLVKDNHWFIDTFMQTEGDKNTLYGIGDKRPLDQWYHAAVVVDGRNFKQYVNGKMQLSTELQHIPFSAGETSLGVRLNKVHWYKGAILKLRFTPRALTPDEFLSLDNENAITPSQYREFFNYQDLTKQVVEGNVERVIYTGSKLQIIEYHFPANKKFTAHSHDKNEQMGYLVSGKMGFIVGDKERVLEPGDFYHAQIGQVHNAWTFEEPAVLIDVFAPPRKDILEYSNRWLEEK